MTGLPQNAFKAALLAGRRQIGLWAALASPYTAEIVAGAGFDWIVLDGEHAPNDVPLLLSQLQAVAPYPVEPVLRPPVGSTSLIKQYLDIGGRSLLIPMVESAEQAAELVRAVRYPPHGVRGVGSAIVRAARWNRTAGYLKHADDGICLIAQIETASALAQIEAIAAVPGIDGLFIGPADLAASLGHLGDPGHAEVRAAIEDAIRRIVSSGKAPGILMSDPVMAERCLDLGTVFIAVGTDVTILARGAEALAARWKSAKA
jgi:4-hydroxy-2-oxoheptanedioate aldolase